jgi:hypothetical protein
MMVNEGECGIWWMYFASIYENRRMKPVEILLIMGEGQI